MKQTVTIPIPEKVSTNAIYAGKHWTYRNRQKEDWLWSVKSVRANLRPVESYPVTLCMTFYLKGRVLDSSNCSFMGKMIEDALVKLGVLKDDSYKYVHKVAYSAEKAQKGDVEHVVLTIES